MTGELEDLLEQIRSEWSWTKQVSLSVKETLLSDES
jgi:hypothetical protein